MEKLMSVVMLALLASGPAVVLAATPEVQANSILELKKQLALGENYRDTGSYELAGKEFEAVYKAANQLGDRLTQVLAAADLGYNFYLSGQNDKALLKLEQAADLLKPLTAPALSALVEDYTGLLYVALQQPDKARASFDAALKNAQLANNKALIAGVHVNQAMLADDVLTYLPQLKTSRLEVESLTEDTVKINLLLNIGEQLLAVAPSDLDDKQQQVLLKETSLDNSQQQAFLKETYLVLNKAYQLADAKNLIRPRSQAEGFLARLYAQQQRNQDALLWLDKAIADAQQANATDLSMQWELLSGKLLQAAGDTDAALLAYQRAVTHLSNIRYGLPVTLHSGYSSIKEIIEPVYRGLADVLLVQATKATTPEHKQSLLQAAVDAMETIKKTELEDFFKDRCIIDEDATVNLKDALLPGVGIVYPVILPDRVELLVRLGDSPTFEQKSVAVKDSEVTAATTEMAQYLRYGEGNYRKASRKLYSWLLDGYDESLKAKGIKTLIYVPDGELRKVPFSALLKGKKFIVEDYTIVTLPSLTLKKTVANTDQKPRALIAALSKPDGTSIDELLQKNIKGVFGERGLVDLDNAAKPAIRDPQVLAKQRTELIEKLSLPGVNDEVSALQKDVANTTLKNTTFTSSDFKDSVGSGGYSIIHIASHGFFGKSAEDSFVMTYDHNLKLDDFKVMLSSENIKKHPINLLTLSACQTAEGDDRALLGFSGIAIKTNALSAIGTLWSVDDAATAKFMDVFYGNLSKLPKAEALRQAQLALLRDGSLKHPHYWSPFILVGNW